MRESNRMLPFREGNHTCPQRHKYSEMVGTHHPVGARGIVAGRFWAERGGETTPRYGCEHATAYRPLYDGISGLIPSYKPIRRQAARDGVSQDKTKNVREMAGEARFSREMVGARGLIGDPAQARRDSPDPGRRHDGRGHILLPSSAPRGPRGC